MNLAEITKLSCFLSFEEAYTYKLSPEEEFIRDAAQARRASVDHPLSPLELRLIWLSVYQLGPYWVLENVPPAEWSEILAVAGLPDFPKTYYGSRRLDGTWDYRYWDSYRKPFLKTQQKVENAE